MAIFIGICVVILAGINIFLFLDAGWKPLPQEGFDEEGDYYNQYPDYSIEDVYDNVHGRIPILMYHMIVTPSVEKNVFEKGLIRKTKWMERFLVSSAELKSQIESLYAAGFRNISLNEYLSLRKGSTSAIDRVPPGSKLFVLTFDDSTYGQFDFTGADRSGNPLVDPDCAVGIMMDFAKLHPDFHLNAAFAVTFEHVPFIQQEFVKKKLNMLLDLGFEIVNHTVNHKMLSWYAIHDKEVISYEIGRAMEMFESYLGYRAASIDKVCYPGGSVNEDLWKYIRNITFNGRVYHFTAALDAKGMSAKNPNEEAFNIYRIGRIETSSETFGEFVLNAPNLYTTPPLRNRADTYKTAFYQDVEPKKKDHERVKKVRYRR